MCHSPGKPRPGLLWPQTSICREKEGGTHQARAFRRRVKLPLLPGWIWHSGTDHIAATACHLFLPSTGMKVYELNQCAVSQNVSAELVALVSLELWPGSRQGPGWKGEMAFGCPVGLYLTSGWGNDNWILFYTLIKLEQSTRCAIIIFSVGLVCMHDEVVEKDGETDGRYLYIKTYSFVIWKTNVGSEVYRTCNCDNLWFFFKQIN